MSNGDGISKDMVLKSLAAIVGMMAIGFFSWLAITTINNSIALSKFSDISELEGKMEDIEKNIIKGRTCLWRKVSRNRDRLDGKIFGLDPAPARCDN